MRYALRHPLKKVRSLRIRELQVGSAASGVFLLIFAIAYSRPDEFVRAPAPPIPPGESPRINVVNFIEQATIIPVWTVLFALAFAGCIVASVRDKYGPKAHLFAGVVMAMYSAASYATAYANPQTYIVTATFAAAFAFAQITIMSTYVHRHEKISKMVTESSSERAEYVALKKTGGLDNVE